MQFLEGSFEHSLNNRLQSIEQGGTIPGGWQSRLQSLENRFNTPSPAITNASTSTSGLSVDLLGVGVMAASGTNARLQEYGGKINSILSVLRDKEIIANA